MNKKIIDFFTKGIYECHIEIPQKYKKELKEEIININYGRERILSIVLILLNIILLYFDLRILKTSWEYTPNFRYLFYGHTIMIFYQMAHMMLYYLCDQGFIKRELRFKKILHYSFIYFSLTWCVVLVLNAQFIHSQISAYIIGAFVLASILLISPLEGFGIYILTYSLFIVGVVTFPTNFFEFTGNILNAFFLIVLAYAISRINYEGHIKRFLSKKDVEEKNSELIQISKNLEAIVNERTEELTKANERLINEIEIRHEKEIEAIQTKLLYEESKRILNERKQYENLRNIFFANLSHELRTPLNLIYSSEQMLEKVSKNVVGDHTKMDKYIEIIKQNSFRLLRLIGNLIDITKIDAGHFSVSLQNCNIIKTVEDITLSVAEYIRDKGINLVFDTDLEEKIIACDPDTIERIILNLLSNAVKFTPTGGTIFVNIYDGAKYLKIAIKDTGIGIPYKLQQSIFERFVQADKSTTRNREGSGIGLSLVKSLVDMHDGELKLISEEGEGAEFIIQLPNKQIDSNTPKTIETYESQENIERIQVEFSDIYS